MKTVEVHPNRTPGSQSRRRKGATPKTSSHTNETCAVMMPPSTMLDAITRRNDLAGDIWSQPRFFAKKRKRSVVRIAKIAAQKKIRAYRLHWSDMPGTKRMNNTRFAAA